MRTHVTGGVLMAAMLTSATAASAVEQVQTVRAVRVDQSPTIDGSLDDAAWNQGQWQGGRFSNVQNLEPTPRSTRFKVGFDDRRLYLAVIAEHEAPASLSDPQLSRDDGRMWNTENVELFLDPVPGNGTYRHFMFSAWGDVYDAVRQGSGTSANASWNTDVKAATGRREGAWTLEASMPLYDLGIPKAPGHTWRFNLARHGQAFGSFAALRGTYHQPDLFARLAFPESSDFSGLAWQIRQPRDTRVVKTDAGLEMRGEVMVTNRTGQFRFVTLNAQLSGKSQKSGDAQSGEAGQGGEPGQSIPGGLDAGQSRQYQLRVPVAEPGEQRLVLRMRSRSASAGQGRPLAKAAFPVDATYQPLQVKLLQPAYRASVYATQDLDKWRAKAVLARAEGSEQSKGKSSSMTLRAAVYREGRDQPLATASRPLAGRTTTIAVKPGTNLTPGKYRLSLSVRQGGDPLHEASRTIRVLPEVKREWRLSKRGVLLRNGKPVLPLGYFLMPLKRFSVSNLRAQGINVNAAYASKRLTPEEVPAFFKMHAEAGIYVVAYPYPPGSGKMAKQRRPLSKEEAQAIRQRVRLLKDQPGLMAYYLADEPPHNELAYQRLREVYRIMKEVDPYHPAIVLTNKIGQVTPLNKFCDILMPDPYPHFLRDGGSMRPIDYVARFTRAAQQVIVPGQSVWITPQVWSRYWRGRRSHRDPNFTELRNMFYQAVVHRAKGLIAFGYRGRSYSPALDHGCAAVYPALRAMEKFILAPEAKAAKPLTAGSGSSSASSKSEGGSSKTRDLHVSSRVVDGDVVIFAVNTSYDKTLDVTFELTGPAAGKPTYRVLREDRSVQVKRDRLSDTFAPLATHVYIAGEVQVPQTTLDEYQKRVKRDRRPKPGNLAHRSRGTKIVGTEGASYRASPTLLNNGLVEKLWNYMPEFDAKNAQVTVEFEKPVQVNRVVLYGDPQQTRVAVPAGDGEDAGWRVLDAKRTKAESGTVTLRFDPVTVSRLRLNMPQVKTPPSKRVSLKEVRVYGP